MGVANGGKELAEELDHAFSPFTVELGRLKYLYVMRCQIAMECFFSVCSGQGQNVQGDYPLAQACSNLSLGLDQGDSKKYIKFRKKLDFTLHLLTWCLLHHPHPPSRSMWHATKKGNSNL